VILICCQIISIIEYWAESAASKYSFCSKLRYQDSAKNADRMRHLSFSGRNHAV